LRYAETRISKIGEKDQKGGLVRNIVRLPEYSGLNFLVHGGFYSIWNWAGKLGSTLGRANSFSVATSS
jgi:hypothetical protein